MQKSVNSVIQAVASDQAFAGDAHISVLSLYRISHKIAPEGLIRRQGFTWLCRLAATDVEFQSTQHTLSSADLANCDTCMIRLATMAANDLVFNNDDLKRMLELLDGA